jgi:hypothetical protein
MTPIEKLQIDLMELFLSAMVAYSGMAFMVMVRKPKS